MNPIGYPHQIEGARPRLTPPAAITPHRFPVRLFTFGESETRVSEWDHCSGYRAKALFRAKGLQGSALGGQKNDTGVSFPIHQTRPGPKPEHASGVGMLRFEAPNSADTTAPERCCPNRSTPVSAAVWSLPAASFMAPVLGSDQTAPRHRDCLCPLIRGNPNQKGTPTGGQFFESASGRTSNCVMNGSRGAKVARWDAGKLRRQST